MLKYLIIPLNDTSVSFCHYEAVRKQSQRISCDSLKSGLIWAMKENLSVQFVYPSSKIPGDIEEIIDRVDHIDIVPADCEDQRLLSEAEIIVFNGWSGLDASKLVHDKSYVVRTSLSELLLHGSDVKSVLSKLCRLNIVITDVAAQTDSSLEGYRIWLNDLIPLIVEHYKDGNAVQINLLTDRLALSEPNDCRAGDETVTLAPDGQFYICPAFYQNYCDSIGNPETGLEIKNGQLYRRDHAPICSICDAYQCKRCVWLNRQLTREVNTPGRQQCVMAHIERNATKKLLGELRKLDHGYLPDTNITEIDYLDPFDNLTRKI